MLDDGTYEAFVVDVSDVADGVGFDLVVVAGQHKGEVVRVIDRSGDGDPVERLGRFASLEVSGGEPMVVFDP